jgi:hypothetical protein
VAEYLGGRLLLVGGSDFKPEKLTVYELGYGGRDLLLSWTPKTAR